MIFKMKKEKIYNYFFLDIGDLIELLLLGGKLIYNF